MNVNAVVSEGVHKKDVYSVISVNGNNLTRFESTVFQSVLEDMTYLPQTNVRRVEISKSKKIPLIIIHLQLTLKQFL